MEFLDGLQSVIDNLPETPEPPAQPAEKPQPRTGSVAPEDAALTLWVSALWANNECPEQIEVYQVFGLNASRCSLGQMVYHRSFGPTERLDIEQANHLANKILAVCQHDCDVVERVSTYQIAVIDHNRRMSAASSPLVRRIGPLAPKRAYLIKENLAARILRRVGTSFLDLARRMGV